MTTNFYILKFWNSNFMKKKLIFIAFYFVLFALNSLWAKDVPQPINGNSLQVTVVSGDKYFDSGGPLGNYLDYTADDQSGENCTRNWNYCGNGIVCVKFNTFVLATGGDGLIIKSGNTIIGNSANGSLAGQTFTSSSMMVPFIWIPWDFYFKCCWLGCWHHCKNKYHRQRSGAIMQFVCVGHVNVSMPADGGCERTLTANDFCKIQAHALIRLFFELSFGTNTPGNIPGGALVDKSHIGYTFIYRVIDPSTQNSCWGYVTVEDKAGPILTYKSRKSVASNWPISMLALDR